MGIPDGMTYFDAFGNFNLLRAVRVGDGFQIQQGKAYPTTARLKPYSYRINGDKAIDLLLDDLFINAESPDVLFSLMKTGVSFALGDVSESELAHLIQAKHDFFCMTREQGSLTMLQNVCVHTTYRNQVMAITPVMVTAAFNPGALAILSLPSYLVLDLLTFATIGSPTQTYGRLGIYSDLAPSRDSNNLGASVSIRSLDDYVDAFHYGNFVWNNSDVWLTMYGLAYCIAALIEFVKNARLHEERDSMSDLVSYPPFNWAYEELARRGALRDPFDRDKPTFWRTCGEGIENAREVSDQLRGALKLAELLQPMPITPVPPGSVESIFYGLIDIFPLRRYFGIDQSVRFQYPE